MKRKSYARSSYGIFLTLLVMFMVLNGLGLTGWTALDDAYEAGSLLKLHHLMFLLVAGLSVRSLPLVSLSVPFVLFVLVGLTTTLLAFLVFPFNLQALNFVYCIALTIVFNVAAHVVPYEDMLRIFRAAFLWAACAVVLKNLFLYKQVMLLVESGGRFWVDTLVAGGVNQEGSILALGSALFMGHRSFVPVWGGAMLLNIVYSSRGGVLICAIILGVWLFRYQARHTTRRLFQLVLLVCLAAGVMTFFHDHPLVEKAVSRFAAIGTDRGSEERQILWAGAVEALGDNLVGYGVMNAARVSCEYTGLQTAVNNLHNIYLQIMVDLGLQGFVMFLWLVMSVFAATIRQGGANVFGVFLCVYYLMGLLRFRAYDPLVFAVLGVFQVYAAVTVTAWLRSLSRSSKTSLDSYGQQLT